MASYDHIDLTDEEIQEAILWRKRKKDDELQRQQREERINERRKALTSARFSPEQTDDLMKYRAAKLFKGAFVLDKDNRIVYDLMCLYFSEDRGFISKAKLLGINEPSLDKGLMLAGNFGVGKTWLMQLFSINQRQVFDVVNAKFIANSFEKGGEETIAMFESKVKNALNDPDRMYHTHSGLCIDDLGTEDLKNHFGNKKNVIGDLIEKRYATGNTGPFLHATTNLTSQQLNDFYGGRVVSRMRQALNFIELPGNDRRK